MKAFEAWIKTKKLGIYIQDATDRFHVERRYKEGWKAALEWVLKYKEYNDAGDREVIDIQFIEEELSNG